MDPLAFNLATDRWLEDEWFRAGGSATVDQRLQDEQDAADRQREREDATGFRFGLTRETREVERDG